MPGDRRNDLERRQNVDDLLRATRRLLALHKERNRMILVVFSVLIVASAVALFWVWRTSETQGDTVDRLDSVVAQIQVERRQNIRTSCVQANEQNSAIRGFLANSLPSRLLRKPLVREYLRANRRLFTGVLGTPPNRSQRNIDPRLVVAYLQRGAMTFPDRDCDEVVADAVSTDN